MWLGKKTDQISTWEKTKIWFKCTLVMKRRSVLDLLSQDIFKNSIFGALQWLWPSLAKEPNVLWFCAKIQPPAVVLLWLQLRARHEKQNIIYPLKVFTQHITAPALFSVHLRGVCLDWLLLVEVSKRTPACHLLLLVRHREKWRKRFGPGVDQTIRLSCNHPQSRWHFLLLHFLVCWGRDSSEIFPRVVDLYFIKREQRFTQLKGINRLKCHLFANPTE